MPSRHMLGEAALGVALILVCCRPVLQIRANKPFKPLEVYSSKITTADQTQNSDSKLVHGAQFSCASAGDGQHASQQDHELKTSVSSSIMSPVASTVA